MWITTEMFASEKVSVAQLDRASASEGAFWTALQLLFPVFYAVSALRNSSGKVRKNIAAGVATPDWVEQANYSWENTLRESDTRLMQVRKRYVNQQRFFTEDVVHSKERGEAKPSGKASPSDCDRQTTIQSGPGRRAEIWPQTSRLIECRSLK